MSGPNLLQYGFFLVVVAALVKPLGGYMARVFEGQPTFLDRVLLPVERLIYRLTGIEPGAEMDWKQYALAFVDFWARWHTAALWDSASAKISAVVLSSLSNHSGDPGSGDEHRHQFLDDDNMASLRRGEVRLAMRAK
jgi:hypothetical protein